MTGRPLGITGVDEVFRPDRIIEVDRDDLQAQIVLLLERFGGDAPGRAGAPLPLLVDAAIDAAVAASVGRARIDGRRKVTILLSDLRGFTSVTERHSANQLVAALDRYLATMTRVIVRNGGLVDKFMGDAIMALFGVSSDADDGVDAALSCAIGMQLAMDEVNRQNAIEGIEPLYMGIGINTGAVFVGYRGSELHREFTAIGDEVNLASRIEAHSLRGQILISENTWRLASTHAEVGEVNVVRMKGMREPARLYELLAIHRPQSLRTPVREIRRSPRVEVDLPLELQMVEGKSVRSTPHPGRAFDLGYGGIRLQTAAVLEPHGDVKLLLRLPSAHDRIFEIWAKVRRVEWRADGQSLAGLEFTSIEPMARDAVKDHVDAALQERALIGVSPGGIEAALRAAGRPATGEDPGSAGAQAATAF